MDLLATVRKEGSRGGTGDFKWSDVQSSTRRENYLGHSIMAPVGRWQKGRDLNWYAKGDTTSADGEDPEQRAARERKAEIRRIKEAEEDAMARALGLPVPDRNNPNMQALGDRKEVDQVLKDVVDLPTDCQSKGIAFDGTTAKSGQTFHIVGERIEGNADSQDKELQYALKEYKRRHGRTERHAQDQDRSRSRSRDAGRERRLHRRTHRRDERRSSRDRHGQRSRHRRSRSLSRDRGRGDRRTGRSRSPDRRRDENHRHRRRDDTRDRN